MGPKGRRYAGAFGLVLQDDPNKLRATIYRRDGRPSVEVHSVRTALRRDARGSTVTDLVIEVTQRRRGYFDEKEQMRQDSLPVQPTQSERPDFKFRAGCTIVIDTTRSVFRHIIRSPGSVDDDGELERVRQFLTGDPGPGTNAFDGMRTPSLREPKNRGLDEPFALLHRHVESE
jgi:hypothetical protein